MRTPRLGILTSHPIQYQAPLFRALSSCVDLEVLFAHRATPKQQGAAGFGRSFDWDSDLFSGYAYRWLENRAARGGVDRFGGVDTPGIADVIARGRFDCFLVMGWHLRTYWQAIRACQRHGVPVLVRGESQLATPRSIARQAAKELLHRWILRQFDALLYIGHRNRQYLLYYGAAEDRLFFSPYVVDNAWFAAQARLTAPTVRARRASLGIDEKERVVLFVGKLIPKKRPLDIVGAISRLLRRGLAVRLLVVGSGPLEDEVRRLAAEHHVRIDLIGFQNQSELPQWYALADLFVLPSDGGETWGLVVNEAMACGTPAVVSDAVGCGPDLIDPGRTGAIFPLGDVTKLAEAIATMIDRKRAPEVRAAITAKIERYSIPNAAGGILEAAEAVGRPQSIRKLQVG